MTPIDQAIATVRNINQRLAEGALFLEVHEGCNDSQRFFENIRHFGLDPEAVLVLSLTPDGDDTVIGRFMTRSGQLYYFDFDLEDHTYSKLNPVLAQGKPDKSDSLRNAEYLQEVAGEALFKG